MSTMKLISVIDTTANAYVVESQLVDPSVSDLTHQLHNIVHRAIETISGEGVDEVAIKNSAKLESQNECYPASIISVKWASKNSAMAHMKTSMWNHLSNFPLRIHISDADVS